MLIAMSLISISPTFIYPTSTSYGKHLRGICTAHESAHFPENLPSHTTSVGPGSHVCAS